jgi:5-(carboxyamino)imidazole ribonucleotide mutase
LLVLVARLIYQEWLLHVATSCCGVPVKSSNSIDGWDSVLSILQMPGGVPVATVALNGAKMLEFLPHKSLEVTINVLDKIIFYKEGLKQAVDKAASELKK